VRPSEAEALVTGIVEASRTRAARFTDDGAAWLNISDLGQRMLPPPSALLEQTRRFYGRALTPATIEAVIRMAELGYMRDLTDLLYETVKIDGHLGSVVGKRHRAVAKGKPKIVPASGDDIDPELAQKWASVVRSQITRLPNWRNTVLQLEWGHFHGRAAAEKVWGYHRDAQARQDGLPPITWSLDALYGIHPRRLSFGARRELRVRDDPFGVQGFGFEFNQDNGGFSFGPGGFQSRGLDITALPLKFLVFLPQLYNDYPEREGYGPHVLYWSFFKRFAKREQMVLLEVFGKPWRIVYAEDAEKVNKEQLEEAAANVDQMGANATGCLPPGVKTQTDQPGQGAGQVHRDVFNDSNDEVSKIVLGETRTTEAKPSALGSSGDAVALDVSAEVKEADSANLSDLLSELGTDIVTLNGGEEARIYAPRLELTYEAAKDPAKETERVIKLVQVGVQLKADEVYENINYTKPKEGDELLVVKPQAAPTGVSGAPPSGDGDPNGLGMRTARVLALSVLAGSGYEEPTEEP
jgi:phage gp29-like protein